MPPVDDGDTHREREHFFGQAKLVAAITMLSRVFGMVRDMAIASLGASRLTDAFQMAFAVPNLFRRLFGEGALSAAFVPVFTETYEHGGLDRARRLLANALGVLGAVLAALAAIIIAALAAWQAFRPGPADRQLMLTLIQLMMPFMVTVCLLALGAAALNCRGHFAYPAVAPIVLNVAIIVTVWLLAPALRGNLSGRLRIVALAVTAAGVLQLAGVLWLLRRSGFAIRPRLRPLQPGIGRMLRIMAPVLVGIGFLQIASFFDYVAAWVLTATEHSPTLSMFGRQVARPLESGVLVRVAMAQRMYQLPLGVLATSLGVAVFPLLSRYAARGDKPALRDSLNRALRLAFMEGLATGVGLLLLAEPVMRLIFVRGNFTGEDAARSADILRMYVLGMWAFCGYQVVTRAFYALKDPKTPMKVSCAMAGLYMIVVLTLVWIPGVGPRAFGLAAAFTFSLNVLILGAILRRRLGRLGGRKLAVSVARSAVACAVMAGAVLALKWWLTGQANWLVVAACIPVGAAVFLGAARLLRCPELAELRGRLKGREPYNEPKDDEA